LSPLKEQGTTSHEGLVWKAHGTDSLIRPLRQAKMAGC
jgi:hypothetical protein